MEKARQGWGKRHTALVASTSFLGRRQMKTHNTGLLRALEPASPQPTVCPSCVLATAVCCGVRRPWQAGGRAGRQASKARHGALAGWLAGWRQRGARRCSQRFCPLVYTHTHTHTHWSSIAPPPGAVAPPPPRPPDPLSQGVACCVQTAGTGERVPSVEESSSQLSCAAGGINTSQARPLAHRWAGWAAGQDQDSRRRQGTARVGSHPSCAGLAVAGLVDTNAAAGGDCPFLLPHATLYAETSTTPPRAAVLLSFC